MTDCRLCDAVAQNTTGGVENTVLLETDNFVVMPTLGQFIEGWLMITSKNHRPCARQHSHDELWELRRTLDHVRQVVHAHYGPSFVFEHGPSEDSHITAGCCVNHTHIHVIPCEQGPMIRSMIPFSKLGEFPITELDTSGVKGCGYILTSVNQTNEQFGIYAVNDHIQRQYMRQLVACATGNESSWDWRICPCRENIQATISTIGSTMRSATINPRALAYAGAEAL